MNFLEQLMGLGEGLGLQRKSPAAFADQPMTDTTSRPRPGRSDPRDDNVRAPMDIDDPNSPFYRQRHGGSVVTGLVDSLTSAVTAPRDAWEGKLTEDDAIRRSLDMAGAMNLGSFASAPAGALGSGMVRASPAERLQGLRGLYEDTTQLLPDRRISWEDLEGKVIIPMQGDRTQAGQRLLGTAQDGTFQAPIDLQGGRNFARAEAAQGPAQSGWASTASGAKPLLSRTQRVADETGRDPIWAYMPLGPMSSDFTRLGWRTYEQMLRARGGEAAMPAVAKDMPFDASIDSMRNWFENATGGDRSSAFKKLATKGRVQASGVDPDEVRALIRDPGLENAREGDVGYGFVQPSGTISNSPSFVHQDYSHHLGGRYLGQMSPEQIVPQNVAFPDVFAQNSSWHRLPQNKISHGFKAKLPYQVVNSEMVDRMMNLQRMYEGR